MKESPDASSYEVGSREIPRRPPRAKSPPFWHVSKWNLCTIAILAYVQLLHPGKESFPGVIVIVSDGTPILAHERRKKIYLHANCTRKLRDGKGLEWQISSVYAGFARYCPGRIHRQKLILIGGFLYDTTAETGVSEAMASQKSRAGSCVLGGLGA
jgi:hypothetical protein